MSPECSLFIVLQSKVSFLSSLSPLSHLRIRPLSRIAVQLGVPLVVEHLSLDQINTKFTQLSVIPEDRSSASKRLVIRWPCSVITIPSLVSKTLLLLFVITWAILVSKVYDITFPLRSDVLVLPSIPIEHTCWWASTWALPSDAKPTLKFVCIRAYPYIGRGWW